MEATESSLNESEDQCEEAEVNFKCEFCLCEVGSLQLRSTF